MTDASIANFEAEVITSSQTQPVLVDFWAPWCGPCKTLGPILEKLETEYAGRFRLVKINTEKEQQLAGYFGVRSVPTCVLFSNGQPVDGFMGALPESELRAFLDKHVPSVAAAEAAQEAAEAVDDLAGGDDEAAIAKLRHALETDPGNDGARFDCIRLLLRLGQTDEARALAAPVAEKAATSLRFDALQRWLQALDFAATAPDIRAMDQQIAADKRNFAARFQRAQLLMAQQQWPAAMDELLEILMRERHWSDDLARKTYIAILEIMAPPEQKPAEGQPPATEDPVISSYRRRLSSVVLS